MDYQTTARQAARRIACAPDHPVRTGFDKMMVMSDMEHIVLRGHATVIRKDDDPDPFNDDQAVEDTIASLLPPPTEEPQT